jgi:hypothetical protein
MRYPIRLNPTPTVPDCVEARGVVGNPITHVKVIDADTAQVFTRRGSVTGPMEALLPPKLQDLLGPVFRRATKTLGPTPRKFHEDHPNQQDETYDPDSSAPPDQKPEQRGKLHPKEHDALQTFHLGVPDTPEEVEVEEEFPQSLPSVHPKEVAIRKTFLDVPEVEVTEVVRRRVEVGAAVKRPMDPDERAVVAILQQFEAKSKETGLRLRTAMPKTDSARLKRLRREAIRRLAKRRIIGEGKPEHYYLRQPVQAGKDKLGFDIREFAKADDEIEKSWDPQPSMGTYSPFHDVPDPGQYVKKVASRVKKVTDFSRAMNAVMEYWTKKHLPGPKQTWADEDDDGTMRDILEEQTQWWAKNGKRVLGYYKSFKLPSKALKTIDKAVADVIAFNKDKGVDEARYIAQVAKEWAQAASNYPGLPHLAPTLMGAIIKTTNTIKPSR